jgi:uncharacterized protein YndB with AHSA1/START domain
MSTTTASPVLEIRRLFDAPPDAVFDAWLEREQWQAWIGPEGCQCAVPVLEPKVGGHYRIRMRLPDGSEKDVEGVFRTIDRPNVLAFTWSWPLSGKGDTLVTLVFRAKGSQTEITLTHAGLPTPEDREGHGKGWNSTLNKLARYVKGETP